MKRLFCVRDNKGKVHDNAYYGDKPSAKYVRNALNNTGKGKPYTVSRGLDHMGKHSGYGVPRMRRQPKK